MAEIEDIPWEELLWPLSLPPGVVGSLDWISGTVFLNVDRATYLRVGREGGRDGYERELVLTQTHETTHYLQVLTMGYLQDWVQRLHRLTVAAVDAARHGEPLRTYGDMVALTADLPASVPGHLLEVIRAHDAKLDKPYQGGLSVRELFEAHALYVELTRDADRDPAGFEAALRRIADDVDGRAAYEHARTRLGAAVAYASFPLVVSLALCASDPVPSFVALIDRVAELTPPDAEEIDLDVAVLIEECCGLSFLGSPVDADGFAVAAAYEAAVAALRADDGADVLRFFQDPGAEVERLLGVTSPAIALQPEITGGIPLFNVGDDDSRRRRLLDLVRAAWFRVIFEAGEWVDVAAVNAALAAQGRAAALGPARAGVADAFYNLGQAAHLEDRRLPALTWWLLAASRGDQPARRAARIMLRQSDDPADRAWLEHFPAGVSPGTWLGLGRRVEHEDDEAARHCYRQAADGGSVCGAYLYGRAVVSDDHLEGLTYLVMAAGAEPYPWATDDIAATAEADALVQRLRREWGKRRWKRYEREVLQRLTAMM